MIQVTFKFEGGPFDGDLVPVRPGYLQFPDPIFASAEIADTSGDSKAYLSEYKIVPSRFAYVYVGSKRIASMSNPVLIQRPGKRGVGT